MRNRRLLWCLGAGAFLLLAGFTVFVFVHVLPDRITPENCNRIKVGMTEAEVKAILGRPPDLDNIWATRSFVKISIWVGEQWIIAVRFNDHAVWWKDYFDDPEEFRLAQELPPAPSLWQKLRRSLGW
jgi:hypothetical protein